MRNTQLEIQSTALYSHPGRRSAQEDYALINRDKRVFVVADGFGGPAPGAAAARLACESVEAFLLKEAGDLEATLPFLIRSYLSLPGNVLFNALVHANRKLMKMNQGKGIHERGGASVLAGFMDGDLLALANLGCCTAWLIRDGRRVELVQPRTFRRLSDPFADLVPGDIPLSALGMNEDMEPEIFECKVKPGDWLLLQTDGLEGSVLADIVSLSAENATRDPRKAGEEALRLLDENRGPDNLASALVIF